MSISFDIIIVNWNAGKLLSNCLESIVSAKEDGFILGQVVVVDNASIDGSVSELENIKLPLTLIRNKENKGFAAACNQGAKVSKSDYLLFLNPDTFLFKNSLSCPLTFIESKSKEKIGILGIQLIDEYGRISRSCSRFPTPGLFLCKMLGLNSLFPHYFPSLFMTEWNHEESREVNQIIGAFFLVRRSLFEALEGFDERFFVYFEEVDFSLRAHNYGCRSYYLADARVYHKGGGTSEQVKAVRLFYYQRSRIFYCYKHFEWYTATGFLLGTLILEPFARLIQAIANRSKKELFEIIKGYYMLWRDLPSFLKAIWERKI